MLRNLILYSLTHWRAIICSIAITAGDYFVFARRRVRQWRWGRRVATCCVAGS